MPFGRRAGILNALFKDQRNNSKHLNHHQTCCDVLCLCIRFLIFACSLTRHDKPTDPDDPLADQNIKDRFYGINDPVADKLLKRYSTMPKLDPPEDRAISTLYVGNLGEKITEQDLRYSLKFCHVASHCKSSCAAFPKQWDKNDCSDLVCRSRKGFIASYANSISKTQLHVACRFCPTCGQ